MSQPTDSADRLDPLARFSSAVRTWFVQALGEPTPIQQQAWEAIASGKNALVIAPTGSGKTLAAFLYAVDRLMAEKTAVQAEGSRCAKVRWRKGVRVLYVSPLKALGADVQRNLEVPLQAISDLMAASASSASAVPQVTVAQRTGDTTPDERRKIVRNPPGILITTPESLYLMLTSQAREVLRTVETVVVDEAHAIAGTKRGAHLSLSLERLDDLLEVPAQRVGLSATVRPAEVVAHFLGGPHAVEVVSQEEPPALDVRVVVPVRDMTAVPPAPGAPKPKAAKAPIREAWKTDRSLRAAMAGPLENPTPDTRVGSSSLWPAIEGAILDQVLAHRSTIVFVNSRGLCERLTGRLNELYAKRMGLAPDPLAGNAASRVPPLANAGSPPHIMRSEIGSTTQLTTVPSDPARIVAKAHHGSVSKERRLMVERELKAGELPCVVATSSLELGIDMGSIDLVIQVAPPPGVSSGLQRIGRANHQVGGRSQGLVYPRTRPEIIDAAAVAEGMREGRIEHTRVVSNALDVLAQQTVAAVAMMPEDEGLKAADWYAVVRRSACYEDLPRSAFDAVLSMLAGRFESGDLADYAPRLVWDEATGVLKARPGSQRLAVTAAGTIPDRGLYPAVLAQADGHGGRRRVGELDEEMVHESRVGDVIVLGASTWRIQEIANDRVIVEPAPGRVARLPFWHGDAASRPFSEGCDRGALVRELCAGLPAFDDAAENPAGSDGVPTAAENPAGSQVVSPQAKDPWTPQARERLERAGLDANARNNLAALLAAQKAATGAVPTDKALVLERCKDEVGDWRIILHSPFGRRVHEPWALAVAQRIAREWAFDPQVSAADDGIIVRIPLIQESLPGPELFVFDAEEVETLVRGAIGSTALFAARFRECAARALLMTPTAPGKRAPLWQQRLKGGQLLEAARREPGFPMLLEAARECLMDVFDLPSLRLVMDWIASGAVRMVEATTPVPSPFAAPLIFGYVAEHLYEGDLPHAEARASLLSLDPALLGELLGGQDLASLLDPAVCARVQAELQRTAPGFKARGAEGVWDLLRQLGPLTCEEVAERLEGPEAARGLLEGLTADRRAFETRLAGRAVWAAADDAPRLHAVLGAAVPAWAPKACGTAAGEAEGSAAVSGRSASAVPGASALLDGLVARYARTHAVVFSADVAEALGIGEALVAESLGRLVADGRVTALGPGAGWVDAGVFRRLRALSLAEARQAVAPVAPEAFVRHVLRVQGLDAAAPGPGGIDGVAEVLAQYEGVYLPMAQWESVVLPARVADYRPALLDGLVAAGEVVWAAREAEGGVLEAAFYPADSPFAPVRSSETDGLDGRAVEGSGRPGPDAPDAAAALRRALAREGSLTFGQLAEAVLREVGEKPAEAQGISAPDGVRPSGAGPLDEEAVAQLLEAFVRRGGATCDCLGLPRAGGVRAAAAPTPAPRPRVTSRRAGYRSRMAHAREAAMERVGARYAASAALAGRWSLLEPAPATPEEKALAAVDSLLDRYGVVTGEIAKLAGVPGGFGALYPALRAMEDAGQLLRGVFVEGMGPAQFATRATVDALRADAEADNGGADGAISDGACTVLAADDPACLYGAALPWPAAVDGVQPDAASAGGAQPSADVTAAAERFGAAGSGASRPRRASGALVVLVGGTAVLYAAPNLKSLVTFSANEGVLRRAVQGLTAYERAHLRREGPSAASRAKLVVESVNGRDALDAPLADLLLEAGFVRLPNGLRLYVDPF